MEHEILNMLIEEYVQIYVLLKDKPDTVVLKGEGMWVGKGVLTKLLKKYAYMMPEEKLQLWKKLRWIDADEGHMTKRITVDGSRRRMVRIPVSVPETILRMMNVKGGV